MVDPYRPRKFPLTDEGFEKMQDEKPGQDPPKKPMEEEAIDKKSAIPQAKRSHPEPSKIEKNRLEYDLPFGWKKIGKKHALKNRTSS